MAKKKVTAVIKLQCPAGKATPAPPVGPALGPHGVSAPMFVQQFNDRTKSMEPGLVVPVVITVYQDKTFTFILKLPLLLYLLRRLLESTRVLQTPCVTRLPPCLRRNWKRLQRQRCLTSMQMILKQQRKLLLELPAVWV